MNNSKIRVYLDNCCFNRPFDNQTSLVINMESIAKLYIQSKILVGDYDFVWSDILEFENSNNPFEERNKRIIKWKKIAVVKVESTNEVIENAKKYMELGIKPKDALHISSSVFGKADYFLTTDNGIIKKSQKIKDVKIMNPIDFVKEMEENNEDGRID